MYGTPNNSIHEFGMTKNVILARLHVGKRHSDRPVAIWELVNLSAEGLQEFVWFSFSCFSCWSCPDFSSQTHVLVTTKLKSGIYILKRSRAFDLFLAKSMLANYTIFWECCLHFASLRVSRWLPARFVLFLLV